jgi:hypothetical protein
MMGFGPLLGPLPFVENQRHFSPPLLFMLMLMSKNGNKK